ncbi:class I SAM-dependent methyltransferase [Candidatus Mycobacterium wuenschmannii]|uniref:Class I SAM-dependent methyltransferase n=2 Tax=Candidatus Mycobacterium wuenschmannii TaxID=3027808 RepID=A0ABY8W6X0_9MYCO|nr:class I SAM-dependent methyltransferase [Candidatus Mycobacterium wuenschmannii]WIM90188.1 class I SAM-dependent methyltransferase [Candidatus Mycobacterium wuenschmannii]
MNPVATGSRRRYIKPLGSYAWFKKAINKYWYPFVTRRWDQDDVVFLNWGYEEDPPMGLPLSLDDEKNRYGIQLYHRTATQIDLAGKTVLEPSCGHGGGAAYVMTTLRPASYTGLDFNPHGVDFAKRRHSLPGLDFVHGDAEALPFPSESFDVVLNVEASHAYPHFERFLDEVVRVLRPGGHFLYVDFRGFLEYDEWDAALAALPLRMAARREINADVLRGLDNNAARHVELINKRLPLVLQPFGRLFAGAPDTLMYKELQRGRLSYRLHHFIKD